MSLLSLPSRFVYLFEARVVFAVVGLMSISLPAFSDDHDHAKRTPHHQDSHQHNQQHSHQHGRAELMLAQEGNRVEIVLESPAANIVGFEYPASSVAEKAALEVARTSLQSPERLFDFQGSRCTANNLSLDMAAVEPLSRHSNLVDQHASEHAEIIARYLFQCAASSDLQSISLNLGRYFSAIEVVDVQWVTDAGQGATELRAHQLTGQHRVFFQSKESH